VGIALLGHWNAHEAHLPHALHCLFGERVVTVDCGSFGREVRVGEGGSGFFDALLDVAEAESGRRAPGKGEMKGMLGCGKPQVSEDRQHGGGST
jgi:hypothetical protein